MNKNKRKTIDGWIDKALNQLTVAQDHLKSYYRSSEAIEAAQECIELSVKSTLALLGIQYTPDHKWSQKELTNIANQIEKRQIMERLAQQNLYHCSHLPRLLVLANLWGHFYIPAKYGFTKYLASAQELLNMAPLWELIPSWQKEPKKAWGALERGDYDWAYQAMDHWPTG